MKKYFSFNNYSKYDIVLTICFISSAAIGIFTGNLYIHQLVKMVIFIMIPIFIIRNSYSFYKFLHKAVKEKDSSRIKEGLLSYFFYLSFGAFLIFIFFFTQKDTIKFLQSLYEKYNL